LDDGIAVDVASLVLYRSWFPQNLNGTDLVPALLAAAPRGTRLFLYGAKPDVVAKTAALLGERYCCTHLRGGRAAFSSRRGGAARA
jgi:UDP-N-acetyl-D-mannosaminuronic acid transferase (WecB/TagA/CpsF family)